MNHIFNETIPRINASSSGKIDVVVGLDARGFLLGPIIAMRLGAAFVPVRKAGKLPGKVNVVSYEKEYGVDEFEMQADAIKPGQNCIVVECVNPSLSLLSVAYDYLCCAIVISSLPVDPLPELVNLSKSAEVSPLNTSSSLDCRS